MTITNQVDATAQAALDLMLRKRAARQAAGAIGQPAPIDKVRVLVTKLGGDKISMGIHIAGIGEAHYEQGEECDLERRIAEAHENVGWVMILGNATGELSTVEQAMQSASVSALAAEETKAANRKAATEAAVEAAKLALQPVEPAAPAAPVAEAVAAPAEPATAPAAVIDTSALLGGSGPPATSTKAKG